MDSVNWHCFQLHQHCSHRLKRSFVVTLVLLMALELASARAYAKLWMKEKIQFSFQFVSSFDFFVFVFWRKSSQHFTEIDLNLDRGMKEKMDRFCLILQIKHGFLMSDEQSFRYPFSMLGFVIYSNVSLFTFSLSLSSSISFSIYLSISPIFFLSFQTTKSIELTGTHQQKSSNNKHNIHLFHSP